jgi:thiol-disulfide isomerase/thioredoxin
MKSKKYILLILCVLTSYFTSAQDFGIKFCNKTSWNEIVNIAKSEGKYIFADMYTEWCGPCYNMATKVFVLPSVGSYYNDHFINVKIDAEKGEGVDLAKTYAVHLYPTYLFIDPQSGKVVHRSSGRKDALQFIQVGKDALTPTKQSEYLKSQYDSGNRSKQLLLDYTEYLSSVYAQEQANAVFDEMMSKGNTLTDPDVWRVFNECIHGYSPYLKRVSMEYKTFCDKFGKTNVDKKLAKETQYVSLGQIDSLCDFSGKGIILPPNWTPAFC